MLAPAINSVIKMIMSVDAVASVVRLRASRDHADERAGDPLHRGRIDAKASGDLANAIAGLIHYPRIRHDYIRSRIAIAIHIETCVETIAVVDIDCLCESNVAICRNGSAAEYAFCCVAQFPAAKAWRASWERQQT